MSADDSRPEGRARSGDRSDADGLSWTVGPAESRLVRTLLYLAEGFFGGALVFLLVPVGRGFLSDSLAPSAWVLGLGALFVVLLARWAWFGLWMRGVVRREGDPRLWPTTEWLDVHRLRWVVALIVLVAGGLLAVDSTLPSRGDWSESLWYGALFVAATLVLSASVLSSKGRLAPDSLTLTTLRYGEWRDLDLRLVTAAERVTLGPFALVWLSVTPGVEKRTATQGVYAVPAAVLDRAWPAFERGLDAPVPLSPETVDRGRFFRRVNRAVALGFGLLALAALVGLAWVGGSVVQLLLFVWAFGGFGILFLKLAA